MSDVKSSEYYILDTNSAGDVSDPFDVLGLLNVSAYVEPVSGDHSVHTVQIEVSADPNAGDDPNNVVWMPPPAYIIGPGPGCLTFSENAEFVRMRVAIPEGTPSQCQVKFIAV